MIIVLKPDATEEEKRHLLDRIDELGLKGHRIGDARISEIHANFIVNEGEATAAEVLALMAFIRDRVYEKRGIRLTSEVHIIGEE